MLAHRILENYDFFSKFPEKVCQNFCRYNNIHPGFVWSLNGRHKVGDGKKVNIL